MNMEAGDRVAKGEDGVLCWTYALDLWHNPVLYLFVAKVFLWISIPMGLLAMSLGDWSLMPGLVVALAIVAGFQLLWGIGYVGWALIARGVCRFHYEMDDEAVALVPERAERERRAALGLALGAIGIAAGRPLQAAGQMAGLHAASVDSVMPFRSVRRVKDRYRRYDLICLRSRLGGLQVFVNRGDYSLVFNYIARRMPEWPDKGAARSARRGRLLAAGAVSLAVNLTALAANLRSYGQTGTLKWAWRWRGGDYGQQRAFALLAEDWYGAAGQVTHSLRFSLPFALIGLLAVALAAYLLLWLAEAVKRMFTIIPQKPSGE